MSLLAHADRARSRARASGVLAMLDRSNISIIAQDLTLEAAPGEMVSQRVAVTNGADSIPSDDPWLCTSGGDRGVNVRLTATLVQPIGEVGRVSTCLEPNSVAINTFEFAAPDEPGDYTLSFSAGWNDPPQLWANLTETLSVRSGGGGGGGGGGVDPSAVTASCSLQETTVSLGRAAPLNVTLANSNSVDVDVEYRILVDGREEQSQHLIVSANDTLSFQESVLPTAGTHDVGVDIASVQSA